MNKLLLRSLSGVLYVALIVGALLAGAPWFSSLCVVLGLLAYGEYSSLTGAGKDTSLCLGIDYFSLLVMLALPVMLSLDGLQALPLALAMVVMLTICLLARLVAAMYVKQGDAVGGAACSVMGVTYLGIGLLAASLLAVYSTGLVLLLFIFIWLNDTGAFLAGTLLGKHRLFERISPKKSWEGFAGGLLLVMATSIVLGYTGVTLRMLGMTSYYGIGPYYIVYMLPLVAVVFSTWGDLFESLLKRRAGVKDSGNLIPGHGGLLDRIDSMLMVMPACATAVLILIFC